MQNVCFLTIGKPNNKTVFGLGLLLLCNLLENPLGCLWQPFPFEKGDIHKTPLSRFARQFPQHCQRHFGRASSVITFSHMEVLEALTGRVANQIFESFIKLVNFDRF